MLLNCKQWDKNVDEWFMHYIVCVLFLSSFKMVYDDLNVSANESIFFSFV